jgi:catechol 2,3-dioxygenase-like lactoylglutathione lyase family enzyme
MAFIKGCNITVMITDMDRSIAFYSDLLGFTLKNRFGNHWAELEGPGLTIALHPTDQEIEKGTNLQIGLRVGNLEDAVKTLRTKGVEIALSSEENVDLASFKDPDGNSLYLAQPKW